MATKKISGCQGLGEMEEWMEHKEFLGQWNYSVWYYDDEYMLLNIPPNPQNV